MESNKFEWTDKLVQEYAKTVAFQSLEDFKKQFGPVPEWESIYAVSVHNEIHPYKEDCIKLGCKIHSVKRRDGEVFTIGDLHKSTVSFRSHWPPCKITGFVIHSDGDMIVDNDANSRNPLRQIEKVKEPILITESGEPIYEGNEYWYVHTDTGNKLTWQTFKCSHANKWDHQETVKIFSTERAVEEWIIWNRPCLSLKEAIEKGQIDPCRRKLMEELIKTKL